MSKIAFIGLGNMGAPMALNLARAGHALRVYDLVPAAVQTLVEAAAWLWRVTSGYQHPVIVLREVRNVKYGTFMQPGHRMDVAVELVKVEDDRATFRGKGTNDAGEPTVSAQFTLHGYGLTARGPAGADADRKLVEHWKARWALLTGELR